MKRFLEFRARWAGSVQDVTSGIVMLAFLGTVSFWLMVAS